MKRPSSWRGLPWPIKQRILRDTDLKYDPYEGSIEEAIAEISHGYVSDINDRRIRDHYDTVDNKTLSLYARQEIESAKATYNELLTFLDE